MSLTPGSQLGPCEIVATLGAGGMGEVFRARDTKLNRDVAIKVLPAACVPDRQKFIAIVPERAGPGSIALVQNWRAALAGR